MALDELPRAARGDADRFVVVAGRAARGIGVAEPEAIFGGNIVGDIGEGRGALVRGNDEVGIVAVVAHDIPRRHQLAGDDIVGDIEHAAHQGLVAFDDFGLLLGAHGRHALHHEAALRPGRHDDGVLHHLRFHQRQDLGTEILLAVGPADAAARDLAGAQMHAFHARRIDEDLAERPRQRKELDLAARQLHREIRLRRAVGLALEIIGAQRFLDQPQEAAQDAVFIETLDLDPDPG